MRKNIRCFIVPLLFLLILIGKECDNMATIADKVQQIRTAVYGKDVRENIASAIGAINTEVESTTGRQTQLESDMATAKADAIQATAEANTARDLANTAATNADTKATLADEKATLADQKATLADEKATAAQTATDNANTTVANINNNTLIIYKPWVNTFADIATTYPTPELGWTTQTKDTFTRYRWNGIDWINIGVFTDDKIGDMGQISEPNLVQAVLNDRSQLADKANKASVDFRSGMGKGSKAKRPMITFVSDDARIQDYTLYKDIFANNGIGCSTAVVTNKVGTDNSTWCNLEQLKELQNNYGWEMVSHGFHSDLTTLDDETLDTELKNSRQWLIDNGFKGYDFLMIPYGYFTEKVKRFIAKYYKGCRNSNNGFNTTPISSYDLRLRWITTSTTVDAQTGFPVNSLNHFKALIDTAITNNSWLIIGTHSWEIDTWGYGQLLSDIIAYAKSKIADIDIVNFKQAFEKIENIIDQSCYETQYDNQFVIGNDGTVKSNIGKTKLLAPNTIAFNTPPTGVPQGYISICNITGANTASFPEGKAGTLITYWFTDNFNVASNSYYAYQEYLVYNSQKKYRRGAKNSTSWYEFSYQDVEITSSGTYDGNTQLQSFPTTGVIITPVTDTIAATGGLPITTGGTLITYRPSSYGYSWQIYKKYQSDFRWTRYATSLTTWSAWTRISPVSQNLTTSQRNAGSLSKTTGDIVFDTTLGKPIWWNGTVWVDATGTTV